MGKQLHEEYQVINLTMEYGRELSGFKYAVSSYLPEKTLRSKYGKELAKYEPYLYLTGEQGEAIMESVRNNRKYSKRRYKNVDVYGYEDGVMEIYHKNLHIPGETEFQEDLKDPLDILVSREEYEEDRKALMERIAALEKAMESLTERQLRRIRMAYLEELSETEISRREKVDLSVVHRSIAGAKKKLKKKMK